MIPAFLRRRPPIPVPADFPSPLHSTRVATRVGLALAVAFTLCFLTGLFSHFHQHPVAWLPLPSRPVWLYRVTQGVHVASGIAAIPLLGIKLWVVAPRFWKRPLLAGLVNALERMSILALIAAVAFELISGLLNVAEFYPWTFFFPSVHYAVAHLAIGALLVHVAVKLPIVREALSRNVSAADAARTDESPDVIDAATSSTQEQPIEPADRSLSRRGLLLVAAGAAGTVTLATVGDRIPLLTPVSVLAQRSGAGPQGLPVNRSAAAAGVTGSAREAGWRLSVSGPAATRAFSLAQLQALPQYTAELPIACVEGWSRSARWTGVRFADLLAAAGIDGEVDSRVISLDRGLYGRSAVPWSVGGDPLTLIALRLNDSELDIDHGFPARLIAPARPGVLQTKWLSRIEVT